MFSPLRAQAPRAVERAALTASVILLAAGAWLAMGLSRAAALFHLHHLSPEAAGSASFLLFFVASWTVMTVAMMLPTSLAILATLHCFAGDRRDRVLLVALVVTGYLLTWGLFGLLVYLGYLGWQRLLAFSPWLAERFTGGAPLLLLLAGAFQFSSLKYKCLEKCRSPFSFVVEHWQGRRERWQAFRLGVDHGLFCVGCCWALMLLMFAVGAGSLAWMLVLAVVMALEKNLPWGRRLSVPVGVALLVWGTALLGLR
jgi:predicted metal-binding membrane protein